MIDKRMPPYLQSIAFLTILFGNPFYLLAVISHTSLGFNIWFEHMFWIMDGYTPVAKSSYFKVKNLNK